MTVILIVFQSTSGKNNEIIGNVKDLADIEIVTALGKVRGTYLTSQAGRNFYAFRGIRYAQPPIGFLRFKAPVAVEQWFDIFDATKDGPMCPQDGTTTDDMSEDCLRLNIYTPDLPRSDSVNEEIKKPVIVFLHPGGFYSLSGQSKNFAGPHYFMDRNVVLVTLNYRLGSLGFLSTGTLDSIGNFGLKDQVMALKWLKLHISRFGGDPGSITLLGYGAGAMAISLHMISPMSKGLFHKVILMSGSATAQWEIPKHQLHLARKHGALMNCTDHNTMELVNCLKKKDATEIASKQNELFEFGKYNPFLVWKPVIEPDLGQERFLDDDPIKLYQRGRFMRIPIIAGVTDKEFVGPAIAILQNETLRREMDEKFDDLAPICFLYERHTPRSNLISKRIRKKYLGGGLLHPERSLEGLSQLYADSLIGFGVHRFVRLTARLTRVFYYQFSYTGRFSHLYYPEDKPYGAVHHDDLMYLFTQPSITSMFADDDPEYRMMQKMTRMWANFAYKGDPNKNNDEYLRAMRWRPFNYRAEPYLRIGKDLQMAEFLHPDRFELWKDLFPLNWLPPRRGIIGFG
ncbi:juvenile hormone esterase [Condylostylus longicornis]|uniref:juvenile hormone esterase n=1 Tax=Condylostylus longicornis TaxID=2530218 RepID=UPI00244E5033|nr:juvenile hormone esterase [Condylostylus longicornis]